MKPNPLNAEFALNASDSANPVYSYLGDDPLLGELVDVFVQEMPERINALEFQARSRDWSQLRQPPINSRERPALWLCGDPPFAADWKPLPAMPAMKRPSLQLCRITLSTFLAAFAPGLNNLSRFRDEPVGWDKVAEGWWAVANRAKSATDGPPTPGLLVPPYAFHSSQDHARLFRTCSEGAN